MLKRKIKRLGVLLLLASVSVYADECTQLNSQDVSKDINSVVLKSSGEYCVTEDIQVEEVRFLDSHSLTFKNEFSIGMEARAAGVKVDFAQYTLISESAHATGARGVDLWQGSNTLLKNGVIHAVGQRARGVSHSASIKSYITVTSEYEFFDTEHCHMYYPPCEDLSYLNSIDKIPPKYLDGNIMLENMTIHASYRGVVLADNHNVIRNSVIEVDDSTAIYMMGNFPIIENNTIIIHSKKNNNKEFQKKWDMEIKGGAIKLRDAKGGIIRNNKIIYKGGFFSWGKAPVAINLLDSKDVLIENNTIIGFEKLVRENGDTSFTSKNNKFER